MPTKIKDARATLGVASSFYALCQWRSDRRVAGFDSPSWCYQQGRTALTQGLLRYAVFGLDATRYELVDIGTDYDTAAESVAADAAEDTHTGTPPADAGTVTTGLGWNLPKHWSLAGVYQL